MFSISARSILLRAGLGLLVTKAFAQSSNVFRIPIEQSPEGSWLGHFTVGASQNQPMYLWFQVSSPTDLTPEIYHPSPESEKLNRNKTINYPPEIQDVADGVEKVVFELYKDVIGVPGLTVSNEIFAVVAEVVPEDTPTLFKHGTISLAPPYYNEHSTFPELCAAGLDPCQIGVAFGQDGTGTLLLGETDESLYSGDLIAGGLLEFADAWQTYLFIATEDKVYKEFKYDGEAPLATFDPYNAEIYGPPDTVRRVFEDLGVKVVMEDNEYNDTEIHGEFPCDQPPSLGFNIYGYNGSAIDGRRPKVGDPMAEKTFFMDPSAVILKRLENNRCRSVLIGNENAIPYPNSFSIGYSFLNGHYLQFNKDTLVFGLADVRTPEEDDSTGTAAGGNSADSNDNSGVPSATIALRRMIVTALLVLCMTF